MNELNRMTNFQLPTDPSSIGWPSHGTSQSHLELLFMESLLLLANKYYIVLSCIIYSILLSIFVNMHLYIHSYILIHKYNIITVSNY